MANLKPLLTLRRETLEYIAMASFVIAIILLIAYQADLIFVTQGTNASFLEPDNYVYYICAQQLVLHNPLGVLNPYTVLQYPHYPGCVEHLGLHQLPALLASVIPLVWAFRILYLLAILAIYIFTLLIARRILDNSPLSKIWRYTAYALIVFSFLLMQQTEILEWRGNTFIVAFQLIIFYLVCWAFTNNQANAYKRYLAILISVIIAFPVSWYMWSAWVINPIALFVLIVILLLYRQFSEIRRSQLYKFGALMVIIFAIIVAVFNTQLGVLVGNFIDLLNLGNFGINCTVNPLQLSELQCLNFSSGLGTALLGICFSTVVILVFLSNKTFSLYKAKYEYYLIGMFALLLSQFPLALSYLRLLQFVAPELAIFSALGVIGMFAYLGNTGSNKLVIALVLFAILITNAYGMIAYWDNILALYGLLNPRGLINVASFLNSTAQNSTVFAYYGYGNYLEAYGHVKVYTDTIMQLTVPSIQLQDEILLSTIPQACQMLANITPVPEYVLISPYLVNVTLFQNAGHMSLIKQPYQVQACGYSFDYYSEGFALYKKTP